MMAADEPGSATGNLASSNCRYFHARLQLPVVFPSSSWLAICGSGSFWSDAAGRRRRITDGRHRSSAKEATEDFRMANGNQEILEVSLAA